jgi:NADH:ubiquinone oxidoreductase subunit E
VETLLAGRADRTRDQLIPLLQEVQAREGYLSQATMTEVAAVTDRCSS